MILLRYLIFCVFFLLALITVAAVTLYMRLGPSGLRQQIEERVVSDHLTKARLTAPSQWIYHPVEKDAFTVTCQDGDNLSVFFCKARNPKGTVILLHGLGRGKDDMAWLAKLMNDWGFNAVVYDSRAHGQSSGSIITYGRYEKPDLADVITAIRSRYPSCGPVALLGISMGAAVAAQTLPLIPFAKCAVLIAPFASFEHEFDVTAAGFPSFINRPEVRQITERKLGCKLSEINPEVAVEKSEIPVLVIHGTKDAMISCQQGHEVFLASRSTDSQWFPVEGADHNNILTDGMAWHDRVYDEIRKFLTAKLATRPMSARN